MAYNHRKIHYGWAFYYPTTQNHLQIYVIFYNTARKEPHFYIVYVKPDEQLEYSTMARKHSNLNKKKRCHILPFARFSLSLQKKQDIMMTYGAYPWSAYDRQSGFAINYNKLC